jgi:hypothetical protein
MVSYTPFSLTSLTAALYKGRLVLRHTLQTVSEDFCQYCGLQGDYVTANEGGT